MSRKMLAELMFDDAAAATAADAMLTMRGFTINHLLWRDQLAGRVLTPTRWIQATITSDLSENDFWDFVERLITPFNGEVLEAGFADPQQVA